MNPIPNGAKIVTDGLSEPRINLMAAIRTNVPENSDMYRDIFCMFDVC